jgi:hypothetical protein
MAHSRLVEYYNRLKYNLVKRKKKSVDWETREKKKLTYRECGAATQMLHGINKQVQPKSVVQQHKCLRTWKCYFEIVFEFGD